MLRIISLHLKNSTHTFLIFSFILHLLHQLRHTKNAFVYFYMTNKKQHISIELNRWRQKVKSWMMLLPLNVNLTHSSSVILLLDKQIMCLGMTLRVHCLLPDLFFRMKCKNFIGLNNKWWEEYTAWEILTKISKMLRTKKQKQKQRCIKRLSLDAQVYREKGSCTESNQTSKGYN